MGKTGVSKEFSGTRSLVVINHYTAWNCPDVPVQDVHIAVEIVESDVVGLEQCPDKAQQSEVIGAQQLNHVHSSFDFDAGRASAHKTVAS